MEIKYSEKSAKQIKRIAKGDLKSAAMIINEIERYAGQPTGKFDIKFLKGKYGLFKRLRVGNYRVIFDNENCVMYIYEVLHRQEAYNG